MRIYFDNCVFQDLKSDELCDIYDAIIESKVNGFYYFYSESHLNDLFRDKSNQKSVDLNFMESIVDNNFLSYNEITSKINYETIYPTDCLTQYKIEDISIEEFLKCIESSDVLNPNYKNIPIDLTNMNKDLIEKIENPPQLLLEISQCNNFYDVYLKLINYTQKLSDKNDISFRELLRVHHQTSSTYSTNSLIDGFDYDKSQITDKKNLKNHLLI